MIALKLPPAQRKIPLVESSKPLLQIVRMVMSCQIQSFVIASINLCVLVSEVLTNKIHFTSGGHVYLHGDIATGVTEVVRGPQSWRGAQIKSAKHSWHSVTIHERFKFCSSLYIHHWHLQFARCHPALLLKRNYFKSTWVTTVYGSRFSLWSPGFCITVILRHPST